MIKESHGVDAVAPSSQDKKERFEALDLLRGLAIVIMALDHSRGFFSMGFVLSSPLDLSVTNTAVFFTRWITHFAAPIFIFLAGIGLYFASARRTKNELAFLAFSRGLWLIFLELTLVGFFWSFSIDFYDKPKIGVLFVIGISMIAMAGLIYLPKWAIALIAATMLLGHNAFDSVRPEAFGAFEWVWHLLHVRGSFYVGSFEIQVIYPFIPWIGVMAFGYLIGPIVKMPKNDRKRILLQIGILLILAGTVLRIVNIYGDPSLWFVYESLDYTIMSFLNFTKYPPSLIYLSYILGFAMVLMSLLDRPLKKWSYPFQVLGRVPFLFYVLHIPILHLGGVLLAMIVFGNADWLLQSPLGPTPEGLSYGYELLPTYLGWILVVWMLYYLCRWFADIKASRKDWWLSYL